LIVLRTIVKYFEKKLSYYDFVVTYSI